MDDTTLAFTFAAMECSIPSLPAQVAAVLELITQDFTFAATERSIPSLPAQVAVVFELITQDFTSAAMGRYRQGVVASENNEFVAAVGTICMI